MLFVTAALFVVSLGYGLVGPLVPALAARGGSQAIASFSWIYASYSAAKIVSQPVGGVLVDRLGPRTVLVFGLAMYATAMAAMIAPTSLGTLASLRAIEGAAEGLVYPSVLATVRAVTPDDRVGRRFGGVLAVGSSGLLLGPVLGALFRDGGLWRPFAFVSSVAVVVGIVLARQLGHTPRPSRTHSPTFGRTWAVPQSTTGDGPKTVRGEISKVFVALRDPDVALPALPIAHNKLAFSGYVALFPLFIARDLHERDALVAVLFLVVGIAFGLAQPIGGALVDRFSARRVVVLALGPVLASCAILAVPRSLIPFALCLAPHVMLQSIVLTGVMKEVATAKGTREIYGGVIGSLATATDLCTILGPIIVLHAYPYLGPLIFPLVAALGIVFDVPYLAHAARARTLSRSNVRAEGS